MDSSNTAGQVMDLNFFKAGQFHHLFERFTVREFQDRIRQVLVSAALRDQAAQPGQYTQEIEIIDRAKESIARCSELKDDSPPARYENPKHLTKALLPINHVANSESNGNAVKDAIRMTHGFTRDAHHDNPSTV